MITPNFLSLEGRVAIVTGGASGIGRATACHLAAQGAVVAVLDRNDVGANDVVAEIHRHGGSARAWQVDVSDAEAHKGTIDAVVEELGRLDILIANAGINGMWGALEQIPIEEFDRTMAINLRGTFISIQAAVPHMKERGGSIVITSSINGTRYFGGGGLSVYAVSKAGQAALSKMLAHELGPFQIRVNTVCPGGVKTNIGDSTTWLSDRPVGIPRKYPEGNIPLTGWEPADPDQVAKAILFLASDAADHITGTELFVDGGQSLI